MQDHTVTLIVAVAGIAGTFGSGAFTQWKARSSQREQWLRDRRNEEFKELMTALAMAFGKWGDPRYHFKPTTEDDYFELNDVSTNCLLIIHNRIYIAKLMKPLELNERWLAAVANINSTHDPTKPERACEI